MLKYALPLAVLLAAQSAVAGEYEDAAETLVCGYLPYRPAGPERFGDARLAAAPAKIGRQGAFPFAWDLARPAFLAAEVAEGLLAGESVEALRRANDGPLSLAEYMLHAAAKFGVPPAPPVSDDHRVLLAAERPKTFHQVYVHAQQSFGDIVAELDRTGAPPDPTALAALANAWRPAYALLAKAHADDKRIELLASGLDIDGVLEREAVACLAHAVALAAKGEASLTPLAKAAAARWAARPGINLRDLPRAARGPFFDMEDAGDEAAAAIAALPDGAVATEAFRPVAKAYAVFVTAAKSLMENLPPE